MKWLKELFCKHKWEKIYESEPYPVACIRRYLTVEQIYESERIDRKWKCSKCGKTDWDHIHTYDPPNPYYR
jgi:hypothetical protein